MNLFESFILYVAEGVSLVPASGEDIERDLTANRERQTVICEFVFEFFDECSPDTMCLFKFMRTKNRVKQIGAHSVINFKCMTLLYTGECVRTSVEETQFKDQNWTYEALRPIGLTLIIPFRNSTNVPL